MPFVLRKPPTYGICSQSDNLQLKDVVNRTDWTMFDWDSLWILSYDRYYVQILVKRKQKVVFMQKKTKILYSYLHKLSY